MHLILTAGQHSGIEQAAALLEGLQVQSVIADKGYDAMPSSGK